MDNTRRVDVFQTTENLVEEILNELLLERSRSEQSVEVGTQQLGDKVNVLERGDEDVAERDDLGAVSAQGMRASGQVCVRAGIPIARTCQRASERALRALSVGPRTFS